MLLLSDRTVAPHWLPKKMGAKSALLTISDGTVTIEKGKEKPIRIPIAKVASSVAVQKGIFFSALFFQTDQGKRRVGGLTKKEASGAYYWLQQHWFHHLAPAVSEAANQINAILMSGYLRQSRVQGISKLAKDSASSFGKFPDETLVSGVDLTPFRTVDQFSHLKPSDIEAIRRQYIDKKKADFKVYFDEIETFPLTELQREACIADEDNNLVLAGAGTGKTSTMVGRSGFLIQSNQAKPKEILMLAFANKAAAEMQERIEEKLGDLGIQASTFHKLGKEIIATVEGAQPSISPIAEDDKLLSFHVNQWFAELMEEKWYSKLVIKYFQEHLYAEANPFDFESEGAYFEYIRANEIRTLKGEQVKGLGECLIANYLFEKGVDYKYETPYEHPTRDLEYRQYQPDFYLPDFGVYLEHVGIDRNGNTAPYVDRRKYHEGMAWKRALHKEHETTLVESYHYELTEGILFEELEKKLLEAGIVFNPLPDEALFETLREFGAISSFAKLLADLLRRYRANCYDDKLLQDHLGALKNNAQLKAALELLNPIVEKYADLLIEQNCIDFDDMIGKAIDYVQSGQFKSQWTYILVDEFQDISEPRARLVKELQKSKEGCALFCVGDDWQAIYRFTGSDISFTTQFEAKFGATKTTPLDLTFRFNNSISDVASRFVLKNPAQVKKQLKTLTQVTSPAVSIYRADKTKNFSGSQVDPRLVTVLKQIASIAESDSSVYVLGRFRFSLPDHAQLKRLQAQFSSMTISTDSIHASKGMEADYVIIVGLESGEHGFPSTKITHPLLDALLPKLEDYPYAEERRLFYVAITRAKKRTYMIADMRVASEFVTELIDGEYPIELDEFDININQEQSNIIKCIKCKTGSLVTRNGKYGTFLSCTNFPLCNHKEHACKKCDSTMKRVDRFKVCINPQCKNWVPLCPNCGAEMKLRKSRYNKYFWGCRNYRKDDPMSCNHTEDNIEFRV